MSGSVIARRLEQESRGQEHHVSNHDGEGNDGREMGDLYRQQGEAEQPKLLEFDVDSVHGACIVGAFAAAVACAHSQRIM